MHRKNVAVWQQEVQNAEDRFFHLAGILCAADQNNAASKVHKDKCGGAGAIAFWNSLKLRRGDDGEFRYMSSEFLRGGTQEKLADEERMPCVFRNHLNRHAIAWVGPREEILYINVMASKMNKHALQQCIEPCRIEGMIHAAPIDAGLRAFILNDEFVFRGAASARAGIGDQRSVGGQLRFSACQRDGNQLRYRKIAMGLCVGQT